MKILVTGGCGFVGSNLAAEAMLRGHEVCVFDNLSRYGSSRNLKWLNGKGVFTYYHSDIRNYNDVECVIRESKPDAIFHLAGQVAMTTSISNPRLDFEVNAMGTQNLLEAVRKYSPESAIFYSSTNKVYGDFEELTFDETKTRYVCNEYSEGFDESLPLNFHSPYGCSKGAADQYLLDYARIFGVRATVFRHSSMYGGNQHATVDQGWIGWFCQVALEISKGTRTQQFSISGSGKQVRDVLHAQDIVSLYFMALESMDVLSGEAYNIGGGIENSLSLLELFALLEDLLDIDMTHECLPWRESDQKVFVARNSKISETIGWAPRIDKETGIKMMLDWMLRQADQD